MARNFKRDAKGRFASTRASRKNLSPRNQKKLAKKKALRRNTTVSRKNGTTYETKHTKGLFGGYTVETKAYRGEEYRGSITGFHGKKKKTADVDFLYVAKAHRGTGISQGLAARQVYHARRHGLTVSAPADRSDGGQKFIDRNAVRGTIVPQRSKMTTAEITDLMETVGAIAAKRHARQYRRSQR